jgi:hypothetical protein
VRVAVGGHGHTPELIAEARSTWLTPGTPHLFVGEITNATYNLRHVLRQSQIRSVKWHGWHNHDSDNRPLRLIELANESLRGRFDWLAVGDIDTCFDLPALRKALRQFDSRQRLFFARPMSETWRGCGPLPNASMPCCTIESVALGECRPRRRFDRNYYERQIGGHVGGFHRPHAWTFGGVGYILSAGLLNSMSRDDGAKCSLRIVKSGVSFP